MEKEKIINEFAYKFKCKKCGKILGGVKNNSTIIFFCWTSRAQNDTGITGAICECGVENLFNIKNVLKKLFDKNLKSVLESSAKKQDKKSSFRNKGARKCPKCYKVLGIYSLEGDLEIKNSKETIVLKKEGKNTIKCTCGHTIEL